jgi:hypothetical protein
LLFRPHLVLLIVMTLLVTVVPTEAGGTTVIYLPIARHTSAQIELLDLVNAGRAAAGCPQAQADADLMAVAQAKSDDVATGRGVLLGDFDYYAARGYTVTTDVVDVIAWAATPQAAAQKLTGAAEGQGPLRWCPESSWQYDIGVGVAEGQSLPAWTIAVSAKIYQ